MSIIQLANNLRRLRTENGCTQEQIAEKLNISRQAYSNYETGKRVPDIDILIRIADIYEVSLEQLITQTCTGNGIINETSGPYYTGKVLRSNDTIYLTEDEVNLLTHYRNAQEEERILTRKVLGI